MTTTPSGHTYVEPTTLDEIRKRCSTWAQGIAESWDEAELPPPPTWTMIGTLLKALDDAVAVALLVSAPVDRVAQLEAAIDTAQADVLAVAARLDGYEERLAQSTRATEELRSTLRRLRSAVE